MQEHWLYTTFSQNWIASNALEDAFSKAESRYATTVRRVSNTTYSPTPDDRSSIIEVIAVQAARHPDLMRRHKNLSVRFAEDLAYIRTQPDFTAAYTRLSPYGLSPLDILQLSAVIKLVSSDELAGLSETIRLMIPQHPDLPAQDAVRAWPRIAATLSDMDLVVIDAPSGAHFVLGDTPLPQDQLGQGFCLPLTKHVAVQASASTTPGPFIRRPADPQEIDTANRWQANNAKRVVIGPDPAALEILLSQSI